MSLDYSYMFLRGEVSARGERHPNHKLTDTQVAEIKALLLTRKYSCRYLATFYNVEKSAIEDIFRGTTWIHVKPADQIPNIPVKAKKPHPKKGRQVATPIFTPEQFADIKRRLEAGEKISTIARAYKVYESRMKTQIERFIK